MDPKEENAHFVRGMCFYFLKHYDEALKNTDCALALVPNRADFQSLRAAAFLMKGSIESFLMEIEVVKKLIDKSMPKMMGSAYRRQFKACFEKFYELLEDFRANLFGPQLEIIQEMIT